MEKRYKVLRFIGKLYKILGIISAVITILTAISLCLVSVLGGSAMNRAVREMSGVPVGVRAGGAVAGIILAVIAILNGGIVAISLYGLGEVVDLIINLEENTRKTTHLLENQ